MVIWHLDTLEIIENCVTDVENSAHDIAVVISHMCENFATHFCKSCDHNLCKNCITDHYRNLFKRPWDDTSLVETKSRKYEFILGLIGILEINCTLTTQY